MPDFSELERKLQAEVFDAYRTHARDNAGGAAEFFPHAQTAQGNKMAHELKTWPEPFAAVRDGTNRHEYRKDDRSPASRRGS